MCLYYSLPPTKASVQLAAAFPRVLHVAFTLILLALVLDIRVWFNLIQQTNEVNNSNMIVLAVSAHIITAIQDFM